MIDRLAVASVLAVALMAWVRGREPKGRVTVDEVPPEGIRAPGVDPTVIFAVSPITRTDEYGQTVIGSWRTPPRGLKYEPLFIDAGILHNIPRGLLSRVAEQESAYNPEAISPAGAKGIMQIIPRWHPTLDDPFDPNEAIPYAAGYLRDNRERFGSWRRALAAYNMGPTALQKIINKHGDDWIAHVPRETRNYVFNISRDIPAIADDR